MKTGTTRPDTTGTAVQSRELAARVTRSGSGVTRCGPGSGVPRLFAVDDRDRLEKVLASMPLRIWRDDEVTPLSPHPNDPPNPPPRLAPASAKPTTGCDRTGVRIPMSGIHRQ